MSPVIPTVAIVIHDLPASLDGNNQQQRSTYSYLGSNTQHSSATIAPQPSTTQLVDACELHWNTDCSVVAKLNLGDNKARQSTVVDCYQHYLTVDA